MCIPGKKTYRLIATINNPIAYCHRTPICAFDFKVLISHWSVNLWVRCTIVAASHLRQLPGALKPHKRREGKPEWEFLNRDINELRAEKPKYEAFDLASRIYRKERTVLVFTETAEAVCAFPILGLLSESHVISKRIDGRFWERQISLNTLPQKTLGLWK